MDFNINMLISLLKLTKEGNVLIENVKKEARLPSIVMEKLIDNLQKENLIYLKKDLIEIDSSQRLRIAFKVLSLGGDIVQVSLQLSWKEFEKVASTALEQDGYTVYKNVRFQQAGRLREIDVVGCKKPLVLCIDCKQWNRGMTSSSLAKIVQAQKERTYALAESLPNLKLSMECARWSKAKFIPAILSLITGTLKFYDSVPVISILQLKDFLYHIPANVDSCFFFKKTFPHLRN
jgi:Holliday junction resolvase-like predicted endonuclease